MGIYKAWSTVELVDMVKKQRCAVLKRLHRLEDAHIVEKRLGPDQKFYWKVIKMPDKPIPQKIWIEPKAFSEMTPEEKVKALKLIKQREEKR